MHGKLATQKENFQQKPNLKNKVYTKEKISTEQMGKNIQI